MRSARGRVDAGQIGKAALGSRGGGRRRALTWLPGIEVFGLGGPVKEEAIFRRYIYIVDVGRGLGLVIPADKGGTI